MNIVISTMPQNDSSPADKHNDLRLQQLRDWLRQLFETNNIQIEVASADASFRRYFRVLQDGKTFIAMDAPPDKEDCQPFIKVAELLTSHHVNAPEILQRDIENGFLLLTDFGHTQYLSVLNLQNANQLYEDAINSLVAIQQTPCNSLPPYDKKLLQAEMNLFSDWFLGTHLGLSLSSQQTETLNDIHQTLIQNALEQPTVFVHRDYHSRNLMQTAVNNPGILDFQDAVAGPLTYDMVSLLKDCYINWPREQIEHWLNYYIRLSRHSGVIGTEVEDQTIHQWFDLMGVQRHLKAIGIFARLNHRDNKPGYLDDIPRTLNYIVETCAHYAELKPMTSLIRELELVKQVSPGTNA